MTIAKRNMTRKKLIITVGIFLLGAIASLGTGFVSNQTANAASNGWSNVGSASVWVYKKGVGWVAEAHGDTYACKIMLHQTGYTVRAKIKLTQAYTEMPKIYIRGDLGNGNKVEAEKGNVSRVEDQFYTSSDVIHLNVGVKGLKEGKSQANSEGLYINGHAPDFQVASLKTCAN